MLFLLIIICVCAFVDEQNGVIEVQEDGVIEVQEDGVIEVQEDGVIEVQEDGVIGVKEDGLAIGVKEGTVTIRVENIIRGEKRKMDHIAPEVK